MGRITDPLAGFGARAFGRSWLVTLLERRGRVQSRQQLLENAQTYIEIQEAIIQRGR